MLPSLCFLVLATSAQPPVVPPAQSAYLKASNAADHDYFGTAVAASGNTIVVGASHEGSSASGVNGNQSDDSMESAGAVYVFVRTGSTWTQQAYLKASAPDAGDMFGQTVAISGDTIVVGAVGESSNAVGVNGDPTDDNALASGAAYVFVRTGTTWTQQAYLKASNTERGDGFGISVAVSGDSILVGALAEGSSAAGVNGNQTDNSLFASGAAYVFVRNGTTWTQEAYLKASNPDERDWFGAAVAIDGGTAVVGAAHEDSGATSVDGDQSDNYWNATGAAYVFVRSGTSWTQQAYLKASNAGFSDLFGSAVAVSGNTIVVGAPYEDSKATGVNGIAVDIDPNYDCGAAYVFQRSGSSWSQQAYLKTFAPMGARDYFGGSVATSGNVVVVGALGDCGLNLSSGAAFAFRGAGKTWRSDSIFRASNADEQDSFGIVSIAGSQVVSGAPFEDSAATGVDGNPSSNSAWQAGAAYVFEIDSLAVPFCFGDGSATACPCANAGARGGGCASASFATGARLSAEGLAAASDFDTLILTADGVSGPGMILQGDGQIAGGAGAAFGDGLLCTSGPYLRLGSAFPANGSISSPSGVAQIPIHVAGATNVGDVKHYQCWYRDSAAFCTSATFNLTQGLTITWEL